MNPEQIISTELSNAVEAIYGERFSDSFFQLQTTKKEFEGDITAIMFPLLKVSKKSPEQTGIEIGEYLTLKSSIIDSFNVVKGFLNMKLSEEFWANSLEKMSNEQDYGKAKPNGKSVLVEFSSPNTNKPLHLGHIRNILLGWSVSKLLEANGYKVVKVNLVNDRGIHICKSMLSWLKDPNKKNPEDSGIKGDHLVGDYYVQFNDSLKRQISGMIAGGLSEEAAEKSAPLLAEAQEMLLKWEQGDREVVDLWRMMNGWVYDGFDKTYYRLGISFDKTYYESQTYLLGKSLVSYGLEKQLFFTKDNGSVWCDLTSDGLDEKLLLRSDGTSVYMTQDLGTAHQRFVEYNPDKMIYVVGNEQDYHFKVLKLILTKLGFQWANSIYHLSYGMVELPEGKMKSREGTVVDADDLIQKVVDTARETSLELGKLEDMDEPEKSQLFEQLGLGALKYFIIKVDPKKTMLFDPKESVDFNGNTGPFIQYTHARIRSILRRAEESGIVASFRSCTPNPMEIELIKLLSLYPSKIAEAGAAYSPAIVANYSYELAKEFNRYYHEVSILKEDNIDIKSQRLLLIEMVVKVLKSSMMILGIELPERM